MFNCLVRYFRIYIYISTLTDTGEMSSVWIRKLRHTFWGEWILACILYCLLLTELRNRLIRFFFIVSCHAFYIPNYHKHVTKYVRDLTLAWKLVIKLFYLLGNVPIRLYYEKTSCLVIHITYTLHVCQIRTFGLFQSYTSLYISITVQCSSKCYSEIVMQVATSYFRPKKSPKTNSKKRSHIEPPSMFMKFIPLCNLFTDIQC